MSIAALICIIIGLALIVYIDFTGSREERQAEAETRRAERAKREALRESAEQDMNMNEYRKVFDSILHEVFIEEEEE